MSQRLNLNLKDRMQEINERFQLKTKASVSNDLLEGRLAYCPSSFSNIRKKMAAFAVRSEEELAALKTDAQVLLDRLESSNQEYEREAQAQLRELEQLSVALNEKVESEVIARREKESQLVATIERRLRLLRGEIEKERAERMEVLEHVTATLRCDVPSLMNEVLALAAARREEEERIGEVVEGELEECEQQAQLFKAQQQENSTKMMGLIRDLTLKARREVEEEKAIREETHEEILSYVEETCNRLSAS